MFKDNGSHTGRFSCTLTQTSFESITGNMPVPSKVDVKKVIKLCYIKERESQFLIPKIGTSTPVYFIHLSDVISTHPL